MKRPPATMALRALAKSVALTVGIVLTGCTTYTYNCNVKDACRTSDAMAPGVHIVTGASDTPTPPVAPRR